MSNLTIFDNFCVDALKQPKKETWTRTYMLFIRHFIFISSSRSLQISLNFILFNIKVNICEETKRRYCKLKKTRLVCPKWGTKVAFFVALQSKSQRKNYLSLITWIFLLFDMDFPQPFHDGGRYHIETSPLIGFYMITASVMTELTFSCITLKSGQTYF